MWLYRLELPRLSHERVDLASGGRPCGEYVIAATDNNVVCEHAELIGKEPRATGVYGATQLILAAKHSLLKVHHPPEE